MRYRHEQKYLINDKMKNILIARLSSVLSRDRNDHCQGYHIRSLYFDDIHDSGYYDKEDGINHRGKYRIRLYNGITDVIYLEKKTKESGLCTKSRTLISKELAQRLMSTEHYFMYGSDDKLLNEFLIAQKLTKLSPRQIVDYTREAFICPTGNVRITFDQSITAPISNNLFDFNLPYVNVLEKNQVILEIKYDEYFPEYLAQLVQMDYGKASEFSKYYECRNASKEVRRL